MILKYLFKKLNGLTNLTFLFSCLAICLSLTAHSESINIPHNQISDHSDPCIDGSIANFFEKNGGYKNYQLTSDEIYYLSKQLVLPEGATLTKSSSDITPSIRPNPNNWNLEDGPAQGEEDAVLNDAMVVMESYSTIRDLTLHGMRAVHMIVKAESVTGITLENNIITSVLNEYIESPEVQPNLSLILVTKSNWVTIRNNILRHAGYDPKHGKKVNGNRWAGSGSLIHAPRNTNLVIHDNNMAYALSAGVAFQGTVGASIEGNSIFHTGLNNHYEVNNMRPPSGDGLTAYANDLGVDLNYYILNNVIKFYHNHGIHVSGQDILIQENEIHSGAYNAIRISDRYREDCSNNNLVRSNRLGKGSSQEPNEQIKVFYHVNNTFSQYNNTDYTNGNSIVHSFSEPCTITP